MKRRWTEEEIWDWYKKRPWITGFNFIPSGAMDGGVWMLQLQKAQRREKELLTTQNPWLMVFRQHTGEIQLTDKLVHTLVERITVYENNRVEICLKYQDERAALLDALEQHGKEVSA